MSKDHQLQANIALTKAEAKKARAQARLMIAQAVELEQKNSNA